MRVLVVPRIANYTGAAIVREVGIIRPPAEFQQLISTFCLAKNTSYLNEGTAERGYFSFCGPFMSWRAKSDNRILKKFDLRNLVSIITDRSSAIKLRVMEDQTPDNWVEIRASDIRERDLLHLKLGMWISYWESMKTNKVI